MAVASRYIWLTGELETPRCQLSRAALGGYVEAVRVHRAKNFQNSNERVCCSLGTRSDHRSVEIDPRQGQEGILRRKGRRIAVPWDGLEECGLHLHELKPKTVSSLGMTAIVQALFFQVMRAYLCTAKEKFKII